MSVPEGGDAARLSDLLPRRMQAGPLALDLLLRDARFGKHRLGLHPREFSLLWRLAETPGVLLTRRQLLREIWQLEHEPETNTLEVHVSRLRQKLRYFGLSWMVQTGEEGGYFLRIDRMLSVFSFSAE